VKNNRRNFLKYPGLSGLGIAVVVIPKAFANLGEKDNIPHANPNFSGRYNQRFNMCGYAAPKLETVSNTFS
jgi:hypothetical protein